MTKFLVSAMFDNSKTRLIGYRVISKSKVGAHREHFSVAAQHEASLAKAKATCEAKAEELQAEADANRARAAIAKATGQ